MSWLRIDDGFTANSKIAQLTDRQFRVWMRLLCHCGKGQDPTVDLYAIREVSGLTSALVQKLNTLELVDRVGDKFEIHDWPKYQPVDPTNASRQAKWRARKALARNAQVTDESVTTVTGQTVTKPLPRARTPVQSSPKEQDLPSVSPELTTTTDGLTENLNGRTAEEQARIDAVDELAFGIGKEIS